MGKVIDYTKSYKQEQEERTRIYREYLINMGMEEISYFDLLDMLKALNYKIDEYMCNTYYNNLNEYHYLAKSMSYTNLKTKRSFAHYMESTSNPEQLAKLQEIRGNYFVFHKGRILNL